MSTFLPPVPLLTAQDEGTESDWPNTRMSITSQVNASRGQADLALKVSGGRAANWLADQIAQRNLVWVAQVRSPSSLFSHTATGGSGATSTISLHWPPAEVSTHPTTLLFCWLATAQRLTIPAELLHPVWDADINVAAGVRMSDTLTLPLESTLASLLYFVPAQPEDQVGKGAFRVEEIPQDNGWSRFEVRIDPDLLAQMETQQRPDVWQAALITAIGHMWSQARQAQEQGNPSHWALTWFRQRGVDVSDDFAPEAVALELEPFASQMESEP